MSASREFQSLSAAQSPQTADVIIVGGGPAGAAALWALARLDPKLNLVLIEQSDRLGAGSSLASLENYRSCWPTKCIAQQMKRSLEVFHQAETLLGEGAASSLALKEQGYLFCGFNEHQAESLRDDVTQLRAAGLGHVEYLDHPELRYRFPWLDHHVIAAKFDPQAGWLDSNALIYAYIRSAKRATILTGCVGAEIHIENGRVWGVQTASGMIHAPVVVLAAGAGSIEMAKRGGFSLPALLRPRQSFTTGWRHDRFPDDAPMLIAGPPFPHVRPEARSGAIFGWEYRWHSRHASEDCGSNAAHDAILYPTTDLNKLKDPRFPSLTLALLARQFKHRPGEGFADPRYLRNLHHNIGYYVYRDDSAAFRIDEKGASIPYDSERALIDAHPEIAGLYISTAHGGHGIMTSPAAGEITAHQVLGLPLPDPSWVDFGFGVHWVENDEPVL